ncbi:hypothetical protein [Aureimonas ureilytica]|uniref:hypothetical protein n=1 Tax=Aureimonas ureilytica TaxID=401562 RepID=UPI0003A03B08|nr:hypothetical protein [Aureimonas ureilytica]
MILDPALKVIQPDHQIFVLHPGDGKRFYDDFKHFKAVFLDLPGANLEAAPDLELEVVRNRLRMARALAAWNRQRVKPERPSTDPDDHSVQATKPARYMREAETLYKLAKPGDLIIIPGSGYNTDVMLAEIVGEFDPTFTVRPGRYLDPVQARRIKFLDRNQPKYEFGQRQIKLMQNRQALIRVSENASRHEFYEHAYGDYVYGDRSGNFMEVTQRVVDQKDLSDALFLTNLYGAMYVALRNDCLEDFLSLSLQDGLDKYYNRELFGDISIEVHSPGFFGRPLRDAALAGYIASMTVLASAGANPVAAADVKVQNSANATVSICDQSLEDDLQHSMRMVMNADLWWEKVCGKQMLVNDAVGLKTKARLVEDGGKIPIPAPSPVAKD